MVGYFPKNHAWEMTILRLVSESRYGGSDVSEVDRTVRLLREGDEECWLRQWHSLAERIEFLAREPEAAGHFATARDRYLRASNYDRTAEFFLTGTDPRKPPIYQKVLSCFRKAGAYFSPP